MFKSGNMWESYYYMLHQPPLNPSLTGNQIDCL